MDQVVVVNEQDEVVGVASREQAHKDGTPHRIAVVYVQNPKGEILVQVRMSGRFDHSSAGHVDPGEEYIDSAKRELEEELGIAGVELTYVGHAVSKEVSPKRNIHQVHVMKVYSCIAEPVRLQSGEVKDVFWQDPIRVFAEMQDDVDDKEFVRGFKESLKVYLAYKDVPATK